MMLPLFIAQAAAAGGLDGTVERALVVHLSSQGLARLGDVVEGLVPPSIPLAAGGGSYDCGDDSTIAYDLSDLDITLSADEVELIAADGQLLMTLYGTLGSGASTLAVTGDCAVLTDLDEVCGLALPTTALQVDLSVDIAEVDGSFDVTVSDVVFDISPIGNPLSDCTFADAVGTLLGQNPDAISDLILDAVEPSLADLPATMESTLEDALAGLAFQTELSIVSGSSLDLSLSPAWLELSEDGLIIGMSADISSGEPSDCVDTSAGPALTGADWPDTSGIASGSSLAYDAGILIGRDFLDQLLYQVWATGALCIELSDFNGIDLTTGFIGGFFSPEVAALFGEETPALIAIDPASPPTASFSDDQPPISIDINDLGIELYTDYLHRTVRALRVDTDAAVGISVALSEGELAAELEVDPANMAFTEAYSDLLWPGYSEGVPGLVSLALGLFLTDDLLPAMSIPSILGAEIEEPIWLPTEDDAWIGAYVMLDTAAVQPVAISGCSADSLGCDGEGAGVELDLEEMLGCSEADSGCETGCASGGRITIPTARLLPLLLIIFGAAVRRRE